MRILIALSCRCGSDIPENVLALGNALTDIVMVVSINPLVNLKTVQAEKEKE